MISRRAFLYGSAGLVASAAAASAYTFFYEPTWLEITTHTMPIRGLPASLIGKRVVQLTDLHVSPQVEDAYLLETFRRVQALAPDIVVYTGDMTSRHPGLHAHAEAIYSQMPRGSMATFASLGNHDYGRNWAEPAEAARMAALLQAHGARVLVNEVAVVEGLHIIGLGDLWAEAFAPAQAFQELPPGAPALALCHNPDAVDVEGWAPFSGWILAGHTHGGQCKPPFLPPPILPVKNKRYTSGTFELSASRTLYINRGIGTVYPVRFNVRPEVAVFQLERA
jgi:predicted MPP superfamily phosphohydrolase